MGGAEVEGRGYCLSRSDKGPRHRQTRPRWILWQAETRRPSGRLLRLLNQAVRRQAGKSRTHVGGSTACWRREALDATVLLGWPGRPLYSQLVACYCSSPIGGASSAPTATR